MWRVASGEWRVASGEGCVIGSAFAALRIGRGLTRITLKRLLFVGEQLLALPS